MKSRTSFAHGVFIALLITAIGAVDTSAQSKTKSTSPTPTQLREEALRAIDRGDNDRAFLLAHAAIRKAPDDPQVVFLKAMLLSERNRFPEAIKLLDDLVAKVPSVRLTATGQTADWMVKQGRWSDAEKRFRSLLKEVPDAPLVYRSLARLMIRQGRRTEAAQYLRQLGRLGDINEVEMRQLLSVAHPFAADTESLDPVTDLAEAQVSLSKHDLNGARQILESLESPGMSEKALLGRVYVELKDNELLNKWVDQNQVDGEASPISDYWFAMGFFHASRQEHGEAAKCLEKVIRIDQTDAKAYRMLGASLRKLGAEADAKKLAQRAELIGKTQALGKKMAEDPSRDYESMTSLIGLLEQLHRPFEALSWRGLRLAYRQANSAIPQTQLQQIKGELMKDRSEWLNRNDAKASDEFVLCGVDLDSILVSKSVDEDSGLKQKQTD